MAKKKTGANGQGESIAGYFRTVFAENPKLLKERSNDKLIERWLADHPQYWQTRQSTQTGQRTRRKAA